MSDMMRVVIADDEPLIRMSLSKKIEEYGRDVRVCGKFATGQMTLAWLEKYHADICLTDINMPGIDGLMLIEQIGTRYAWMKCVVISGYNEFEYARKSLSLGVVDYILKPIDRDILGEALDRATQVLVRQRKDQALDLLLSNLHAFEKEIDAWTEAAGTLQFMKLDSLLTETLDLLEKHLGRDRYHLFPCLAGVWLKMIGEKLGMDAASFDQLQGRIGGDSTPLLERAFLPVYFRAKAEDTLRHGGEALCSTLFTTREKQDSRVVHDVKTYIDLHYAGKISLHDIAAAVCMSRTYLANLYKSETGETIWHRLVAVRMEKAKELLLTTGLRTYEVADKVGYGNSIHFSTKFREYTGLTPGEYKKRMKA